MPDAIDLAAAKAGDFINFAEEVRRYEIMARGERYLVCTKPFVPKRTVMYTVIDLVEQVRGTENLIFGYGAETREQCEAMVARLEDPEHPSEVSHRNRVPLRVVRVFAPRVAEAWERARPTSDRADGA